MGWTLYRTETFVRTARKFFKRHPDLLPDFSELLGQLQADPFAPRLRLHPLSGRHQDKHSVSLTYSVRVVLTLRITEKEIFLLDVGGHDEVYR